jgi:hypothetical protein
MWYFENFQPFVDGEQKNTGSNSDFSDFVLKSGNVVSVTLRRYDSSKCILNVMCNGVGSDITFESSDTLYPMVGLQTQGQSYRMLSLKQGILVSSQPNDHRGAQISFTPINADAPTKPPSGNVKEIVSIFDGLAAATATAPVAAAAAAAKKVRSGIATAAAPIAAGLRKLVARFGSSGYTPQTDQDNITDLNRGGNSKMTRKRRLRLKKSRNITPRKNNKLTRNKGKGAGGKGAGGNKSVKVKMTGHDNNTNNNSKNNTKTKSKSKSKTYKGRLNMNMNKRTRKMLNKKPTTRPIIKLGS